MRREKGEQEAGREEREAKRSGNDSHSPSVDPA
jgi:hypothetical protein